jgi:hypothetical protein
MVTMYVKGWLSMFSMSKSMVTLSPRYISTGVMVRLESIGGSGGMGIGGCALALAKRMNIKTSNPEIIPILFVFKPISSPLHNSSLCITVPSNGAYHR